MRSHLTPDHQTTDHHQCHKYQCHKFSAIIIFISKHSPGPWESFTPRCMQALIMSEAGHSSDTGETIFDTDGLAPPASHRRKRHPTPTPPPKKTPNISQLERNLLFDYIYRPPWKERKSRVAWLQRISLSSSLPTPFLSPSSQSRPYPPTKVETQYGPQYPTHNCQNATLNSHMSSFFIAPSSETIPKLSKPL